MRAARNHVLVVVEKAEETANLFGGLWRSDTKDGVDFLRVGTMALPRAREAQQQDFGLEEKPRSRAQGTHDRK